MRRSRSRHQKRLPLEIVEIPEGVMRAAYQRCRLAVSFEAAMQDRGLKVCLRNVAVSVMRKGRGF